MADRMRMMDEPGPFERLAEAWGADREMFGRLVYEQALALSGGLSGHSGLMTDGELRHAALELATTCMALYASLGSSIPLAALRTHANDAAKMAEQRAAA